MRPLVEITQDELVNAMFNAYDLRDRLRAYNIVNEPRDADGSSGTIGGCIDEIIELFEGLDQEAHKNLFNNK